MTGKGEDMKGEEFNFKNWREIRDWAEERGYKKIAKRLELNNKYWNSCGEFGRSQVAICDAIRYAQDIEEVADVIEQELESDEVLALA